MKFNIGHVILDDGKIIYDLDHSIGWLDHMSSFLKTFNNIALGLSGGADSESIAELLYRNKIKFTPIIVDYVGKNSHDIAYAIRWCHLRQIPYKLVTLDPTLIWSNVDKCLELASLTKCISPQYLVYMEIYKILSAEGTPIMPIGEPEMVIKNEGTFLIEKSMHFTVESYRQLLNLQGTALPFQLNRSAMSSWINDPFWRVIRIGENSKQYKADWYRDKLGLMKRTKRDGFENFREEDKQLRTILESHWPEQLTLIETAI